MGFDQSKVLMRLPEGDWTVDDATKGVAIFGGTGSGKTSGSGRFLAFKYLEEGWGGLVLCVKTDEADLWKYCDKAGRGNDVIVFKNGAVHQSGEYKGQLMVFNPIEYEVKRPRDEEEGTAEAQNITNIFMNIYRMGNRISGSGENREERFWDVALKRCINRVVELLMLAEQDLSIENMRKVLTSCIYLEDVENLSLEAHFKNALDIANSGGDKFTYNDNYCFLCLITAAMEADKPKDIATSQSLSLVKSYFLREFGSMGGRVRSTITESFMGLAEPFLSGMMFRHFSGVTNLFPEITFTERKIIILDFSVKEFLDVGIIAQSIYKMMFQQAVERRNVEKYPTPVFLWADEAQMFINPYDQVFLTTARSKRVATVFLTQNIPNYLVAMGGSDAKAKVDSLLGNLSTKIFHANMDAETNEYASRLIGQTLFGMASESTSKSLEQVASRTVGISMQLRPQILPLEFITLRTGGERNDKNDNYIVDAILTVLGKKWKNINGHDDSQGKPKLDPWLNYTRTKFNQLYKL